MNQPIDMTLFLDTGNCCEDANLLTISDPGYIPVHLPSTHGNDDALQDSPLKRPNPDLKLS